MDFVKRKNFYLSFLLPSLFSFFWFSTKISEAFIPDIDLIKIWFLCSRNKELIICTEWWAGILTGRKPKAQSRSSWGCRQLVFWLEVGQSHGGEPAGGAELLGGVHASCTFYAHSSNVLSWHSGKQILPTPAGGNQQADVESITGQNVPGREASEGPAWGANTPGRRWPWGRTTWSSPCKVPEGSLSLLGVLC